MEEGNFEVKCASIIIWPWVKYKMFVYVKISWISSTEGTIQPQSNEKISRYSLCLWPLISKDAWALVSASLCDPTLLYLHSLAPEQDLCPRLCDLPVPLSRAKWLNPSAFPHIGPSFGHSSRGPGQVHSLIRGQARWGGGQNHWSLAVLTLLGPFLK